MSDASFTSADGTVLRRYACGQGPPLVIVHGGMQRARSHSLLAAGLADRFTVHTYDRRGRGGSGPPGPRYGMERECEDLAALLRETGATDLFGHSSGALIGLEAARTLPLRRVALYEPPLSLAGSVPTAWLPRFEAELARGRTAAAMVTAASGLRLMAVPRLVPRFLLVWLVGLMLRQSGRDDRSWVAGLAQLVPTQRLDMRLVEEMDSTAERFRTLPASVLLLGGGRAPAFLGRTLDALEQILPVVQRIRFPDLTHSAPDDSTPAAQKAPIAAALKSFFV